MNEKVRNLTKDAIFIALLTAIIIILKYFFFMLESMLLLVISLFIGVRYHKSNIERIVLVSLSLFFLSFLYFDFLSILIYILPGIILGIVSHYLLKIIRTLPYYLSTISIYFIVHSLIEMLYASLLLNLKFYDYLISGMEFPESITSKLGITGLIIIFFGYNLFMALMESFIIRRGVFIYEIIKTKLKKNQSNN
ncbi:hypothetical protein J6Y73_04725 [bacterium]|nr:hypothetical protein [bacterium]